MARILKEEKYPNGSLKSRETELHGQPGKRVILKEGWYPLQVDPLNPWQATDAVQQRSGQQMYKENFVNGQQHGVQEAWYRNGQLWYKVNCANKQKHGLHEVWHENGQQWYKFNYVNEQQHGVQEAWYENGRHESKGNYVNGQYHGVQAAWNENGQQQDNKYYLDGVEKSQQAYQSYVGGLASEIQAATNFGERGLSGIIAGYLLP